MIDVTAVRRRFEAMKPSLDERQRRLFAAGEVIESGAGSLGVVCRGTGLSAKTVRRGIRDLAAGDALPPGRVRRPGGGRKRCVDKDAGLLASLRDILETSTRGDPQAPLLWTSRSVAHLRQALAVRQALGSATAPSVGCSMVSATASRPTARPARARIIPTGMRSSRLSPRRRSAVVTAAAKRGRHRGGEAGAGRGRTSHLGGHQEEGTDR